MDVVDAGESGGIAIAPLFAPMQIGALTLSNRIVMAPMTRHFSPGGIPGDDVLAYYRRRAEGGVGLILTEGIYIAHHSAGDATDVPRLESDATIAAWRRVTDAVHAAGARIFPQLWHIGLRASRNTAIDAGVRLLGPSGLDGDGNLVDRPMSHREIDAIVEAFGHSAAAAKEAGFDGVEIHAAHGYLIDQFFWERTNRRDDAYGGDLDRRMRFGAEVVREIRSRVGSDFPIALRFSQWKISDVAARPFQTPEELARFLKPLVDAGVDIFDCSQRRFWEAEFEGSDLNLAGWTRKLTSKPVMTVGYIGTSDERDGIAEPAPRDHIARLMARMRRGEFDLAAIGRALIADPDWPKLVREGRFDEMRMFSRPHSREVLE